MKTNKRNRNLMASTFLKVVFFASITFIVTSCLGPAYVTRTEVRTVEQPVTTQVVVEQPDWAPPYDNNGNYVNYYYIPDLQMYYDTRAREYVYMNNGNWVFSSYLPPMYSNYNLNDAFVVVLDYNIHQPWRQHNVYASHYPPYYYKSKYRDGDTEYDRRGIRGYNENRRDVVYRKNNEPVRREAVRPVENHDRREEIRPVEHVEERGRQTEHNTTTRPEEHRNNQEVRTNENNRPNNNQQQTRTEEIKRPAPAENNNRNVKVEKSTSHSDNTKKAESKSTDTKKNNGDRR